MAQPSSTSFSFLRLGDTLAARTDFNRLGMNWVRTRWRARHAHQKKPVTPATKTGRSHNRMGYSKRMTLWEPAPDGLAQGNFEEKQSQPRQDDPGKELLDLNVSF